MNLNTGFIPLIAACLLCSWDLPAQTTGTRLGSNHQETTVVWFETPREVQDIRKLLQEGKIERAVSKARDFVELMQYQTQGEGLVMRYFALNALCAALIKAGNPDEALAACNEAIALIPSRWQAFNNRGTAYLISGQYHQALQDYRHALEIHSGAEAAAAILESNIRLAESRQSEFQ